jgi:hypothetical protein
MKTTYFNISLLVISVFSAALLSFSYDQFTSAQMMTPDMTGNGTVMINRDEAVLMMNPDAMLNGSMQNPMMIPGQNITGSINLMPMLFNFISSQINVSLSDAAVNAQSHVGTDSHPVAGHIDVINGYLTYNICVIDSNMNLHILVVDVGNGKVLSDSIISWQKMGMFNHMMGPMMMNPNMMGPMMMNPNMMGPMMMNPNMMGPMMMNPNMMGNITSFK